MRSRIFPSFAVESEGPREQICLYPAEATETVVSTDVRKGEAEDLGAAHGP